VLEVSVFCGVGGCCWWAGIHRPAAAAACQSFFYDFYKKLTELSANNFRLLFCWPGWSPVAVFPPSAPRKAPTRLAVLYWRQGGATELARFFPPELAKKILTSSTAQPRQGRGLTATSMRTTAWLSTAWAARLIRAGRAAQSGWRRRMCARPCCV
jgi:hypothetical protein